MQVPKWLLCGGCSDLKTESEQYYPQANERSLKMKTGRTSSHYSLNYKGAKRRLFRLDHKKVKVLRCFKQDHIIKKFDELSEVEDKRNLNRQIELLDLDIIDLNYHNLMVRKLYKIPKTLEVPYSKVMNLNKFLENDKKKFLEVGLKAIAHGKTAIIIDASDPGLHLKLNGVPQLLKRIPTERPIHMLELMLNRLKDLGNHAMDQFGEGYDATRRDPILVVLCVNEMDIGIIEDELVQLNYYGYKGILCFTIGVSPYLYKGKKVMLTKDDGSICYSSVGPPSTINSLNSYNVFQTFKNEGIEYINIVDLKNINNALCDPVTLGLMIQNKFKCLIDVQKVSTTSIDDPVILLEKDKISDEDGNSVFKGERLNEFYPFEISRINYLAKKNLGLYSRPYLNLFTRAAHLFRMNKHEHELLYRFRVRESEVDCFADLVDFGKYKEFPLVYKFYQSVFNVFGFHKQTGLILRENEAVVLWKHATGSRFGTKKLSLAVQRLINLSNVQFLKYGGDDMKKNPAITKQMIQNAYYKHPYQREDYKKCLSRAIRRSLNQCRRSSRRSVKSKSKSRSMIKTIPEVDSVLENQSSRRMTKPLKIEKIGADPKSKSAIASAMKPAPRIGLPLRKQTVAAQIKPKKSRKAGVNRRILRAPFSSNKAIGTGVGVTGVKPAKTVSAGGSRREILPNKGRLGLRSMRPTKSNKV